MAPPTEEIDFGASLLNLAGLEIGSTQQS